jgi:hypothetical protein
VPLVNQIWRHLATLPGVLDWAWAATRGPLESGAVAAARARVAAALPTPAAPQGAVPPLAAADRAAALAVVESYNRGNLTNLILLTALRRAMTDAAPHAPAPPPGLAGAAADDTAPVAPVPPLPAMASLPAETQALVRGLAARHAGAAAGGVVPSLYLHLAHWPALLAALPELAGEALARIDAGREAAVAAAEVEADALRPLLGPEATAPVPNGHGPAVLAVLTRFTTQVIPEMVPIGLALRRALAAPG